MNKNTCPMCGHIQSHPTWNCMQGHMICSKCCKKTNACPICTSSSVSCMYCDTSSSDISSHLQSYHNFDLAQTAFNEIRVEISADLSVFSLRRIFKLFVETDEKNLAVDLALKEETLQVSVYSLKKNPCSVRIKVRNKSSESQILFLSETGAEAFCASLKQIKDHYTYINPAGNEVFCVEIDTSQEILEVNYLSPAN